MRADLQYPEIERIGIDEARRRVDSGRALFVDVRRSDAFAAGHIPGAVSAPARAIIARTHGLRHGREAVIY